MGSFINFLNENYAPLYHFIMITRLAELAQFDFLDGSVSDMILPSYLNSFGREIAKGLPKEKAIDAAPVRICFTRNKNFNISGGKALSDVRAGARIEFDKDKLASKYKFEKYASLTYEPEIKGDAREKAAKDGYINAYRKGESEERILFKNKLADDDVHEDPRAERYYNKNGDVNTSLDTVGIANVHKFINRIDIMRIDPSSYTINPSSLIKAVESGDKQTIAKAICYAYIGNRAYGRLADALSRINNYCEKYNIKLTMPKYCELLYKVNEKCERVLTGARSESYRINQILTALDEIEK